MHKDSNYVTFSALSSLFQSISSFVKYIPVTLRTNKYIAYVFVGI